MKKPNNWSIAGMVAGGLFSLLSAIRYFVIWPDMDKAISYVIIGVLIIGVSWLYNEHLKTKYELQAMGEHMKDMHDEIWKN